MFWIQESGFGGIIIAVRVSGPTDCVLAGWDRVGPIGNPIRVIINIVQIAIVWITVHVQLEVKTIDIALSRPVITQQCRPGDGDGNC